MLYPITEETHQELVTGKSSDILINDKVIETAPKLPNQLSRQVKRNFAQNLLATKGAKEEAAKLAASRAIAEAKSILENAKLLAETPTKTKVKPLPLPTNEQDLVDLINWVYSIPYTRRLTFIPRDFSDGVLVAEIVKYFIPELVDLHNYPTFFGRKNKVLNWEILNQKVFSQLGFKIGMSFIEKLVAPKRFNVHEKTARIYPIEKLLVQLRDKLGKINPRVYEYRSDPSKFRLDPFKKKESKRSYRPLSSQPMSEIMWRIEREASEKYGEYKGNPITWDNLPEWNEEAELAQASVGITKQKYQQMKLEKNLMKLKAKEDKNKSDKEKDLKFDEEGDDFEKIESTIIPRKEFLRKGSLQTIDQYRPKRTASFKFNSNRVSVSEHKMQKQNYCYPSFHLELEQRPSCYGGFNCWGTTIVLD